MAATLPELCTGYSQALYSTWLWYRPFRLLFDAGEGAALHLQNSVFGIRHILLSHGHLDHLSGLPSIFNIRHNGMGDNVLPLTIAHPANDILVAWMRAYLESSAGGRDLEVEWLPLQPADRLPLESGRSVEAFATQHIRGYPTLGYRVLDQRRRLRPELQGRPEAEIRALVKRDGRDAITAGYEHPLLVYGGDGLPPAAEQLAGADIAALEATFLNEADRGRPTHATVAETVRAAAEAGVGTLLVLHVSGRYRLREATRAIWKQVAVTHYDGDVLLLWRERLVPVCQRGEPVRTPDLTPAPA